LTDLPRPRYIDKLSMMSVSRIRSTSFENGTRALALRLLGLLGLIIIRSSGGPVI